ncbi:MAG: pyridoxamine 5'-phosphate oxidase family protein [Halobacteriales archaeon]
MARGLDVLQGHGMSDEEIRDLLASKGHGVLSMANDGVPYGIPLSFGYGGGDRIYFLFAGHSEEGRKVTYAERSEAVSFLVYDVLPEGAWQSVIVEGTLDRIDAEEWDAAREAMGENAYRPDLLANVDSWEDPRVWAIEIEEWSGRASDAG